jgi:hypothetical protein
MKKINVYTGVRLDHLLLQIIAQSMKTSEKLNEKNLDLKLLKKLIATFIQMVNSGTLNIVKFVQLDKSFLFIDDCGMSGLLNMIVCLYSIFFSYCICNYLCNWLLVIINIRYG